jgi:predicted PurR-regulated permease PerM
MKDRIILRAAGIFFLVFIFFVTLFVVKVFIVPVVIAGLFALLLKPVHDYLSGKKWNSVLSVIICLLIIMVVVSAIVTLFSSQVINLADEMPLIKSKITEKLQILRDYIESNTPISAKQQIQPALPFLS